MAKKLTVKDILELKGKRKIVAASSFGYFNAKAQEEAGVDILGTNGEFISILIKGHMTIMDDTIEDALASIEGVRNGAPNTFLFVRPPYGYHFLGVDDTLRMASKLIKGGADAVRLQVGSVANIGDSKIEKIRALTREGIPCAGHIGLVPRYTTWFGGFRCQGKRAEEAIRIYRDAVRIQEAGAIWIETECVPHKVAAEITKRIKIPILGIGSGPGCDGEIQVHLDTLGLHDGHYPKHSKIYMNHYKDSVKAFKKYREEVLESKFPSKEFSFEIEEEEFEKFIDEIDKN